MSHRPRTLVALVLTALTLAACADSTAPVASNARVMQPGQPSFDFDPNAGECRGGYMTSTGKAC